MQCIPNPEYGAYHFKTTQQTSMLSQLFSESSGIHAIDSRNALLDEPLGKRLLRRPMRVFPRITGNDQTLDMNISGFKILGKAVFIDNIVVGNSIVSS
jgi:hypothetical protein